jgi:hypothetical protein
MPPSCPRLYTLLKTGAHALIDYLMVFALFLLLVVLSLPTIIHLSAILKEDAATTLPKNTRPVFANVRSSSRLTPTI